MPSKQLTMTDQYWSDLKDAHGPAILDNEGNVTMTQTQRTLQGIKEYFDKKIYVHKRESAQRAVTRPPADGLTIT